MAFVYRMDDRNVGDHFCAPHLYFDFKPSLVRDIHDPGADYSGEKVVIVGGGGLGRKFFSRALGRLSARPRPYALIAWGVGADTVIDKTGKALDPRGGYDLFSPYFDGFDEVGTRSWQPGMAHRWVPCASAMHGLLDRYRDRKPTRGIGYYQHKHSRFGELRETHSVMTNNGNDIAQKLEFLSDHEYIVSNTYHGVYWATLLERKVLCVPFKSGLFSFRHKPVHVASMNVTEEELGRAAVHAGALEECRAANVDYYHHIINKYDVS